MTITALALTLVAPHASAAASKVETKFSVNVDPSGHVTADLMVINNSDRNICMLLDRALVLMTAADGSVLGNPPITDFLMPDTIRFVWKHSLAPFDLPINGSSNLSPNEVPRFARAKVHLHVFDCLEYFRGRNGEAKILYKRDLTATPTFEH